MSTIKASDLLVRALEAEGVEYVFGIPGEENLDMLESLRTSKIKLVVTRHEQAAGFMAATVGRLTQKVGVAMATLGPGATNFTTSAAYASLGGMASLYITGQKPIRHSKQGQFQIVDVVKVFSPLCKFVKQIVEPELIPSLVRESIRIAEEEKTGPTFLELPEDIAAMDVPSTTSLFQINPARRPVAEDKAILQACELIKQAKRPLLVIAAGANRKVTHKMLLEFVEQLQIPFICTQMGKGVINEDHPLFLGTAALSKNDYVHLCVEACDLIINVGHDVVEKPPFFMSHETIQKVLHVNFYSANVDSVYFPHLEVVGDIANAMWRMKEEIKAPQSHWDNSVFLQVQGELNASLTKTAADPRFPMHIGKVVDDMRTTVEDDAILCLDNGMYKIWFARSYRARQPNTVLLDNALATMGAGLPSAIAAKLLHPERQVIAICGDGGFMMNSQEIETARRLGLHLIVIVLNDSGYGMIKWKQGTSGFDNWGLDFANPDFVKYAESYGCTGHRVGSTEDFPKILSNALGGTGVHLIEVPLTYEESDNVLNVLLKKDIADLRVKLEGEFIGNKLKTEEEKTPITTKPKAQVMPENNQVVEEVKTITTVPSVPSTPSSSSTNTIREAYPYFLANKAVFANKDLDVTNKYTNNVATQVALADEAVLEEAIAAAHKAAPAMAKLPSYKRKAVLEHVVEQVKARFDEFAHALCIEAGKPIKDARGEVTRLIDTFALAAEESTRIYGEWAPMDISARNDGYQAITRKFPIGPVSMISPFNFPLNLAAHKIAPCIAAGNPFCLKPASKTPLGAILLGEILAETDLPVGAFSILPCTRAAADLFTTDDRFKLLSFTGSPGVGWDMKARAGKKKVILELGGNAACIVDDLSVPLEEVTKRIIHGAFYQSGQSCISVQRVLVRDELYDDVKNALVEATKHLKIGDPLDESTFIGPMISEAEATRLDKWIQEASSTGGNLLIGGKRTGNVLEPTIVENCPKSASLNADEAFGPAFTIQKYSDFKQAIEEVNDSIFGLQAGVFTTDIRKSFYAFENLEVGGVVINNVPSVRIDSQAYGGVKDSGLGREGLRYAIEDMVEPRVMLLKDIATLPQ